MLIAIRTVGAFLIVLGGINLAAIFVADLSQLVSPVAVTSRYSLMVVSGFGFLLARRWAVFVFLGSVLVNWITFFLIYDQRSIGPAWLSVPIPLIILTLSYFAWDKLKPGFIGKAKNPK